MKRLSGALQCTKYHNALSNDSFKKGGHLYSNIYKSRHFSLPVNDLWFFIIIRFLNASMHNFKKVWIVKTVTHTIMTVNWHMSTHKEWKRNLYKISLWSRWTYYIFCKQCLFLLWMYSWQPKFVKAYINWSVWLQ